MKKTILVLNSIITFSIIFAAFGMQEIETNKKEIVFQSHFNDPKYFNIFLDLSKDFKWNNSGKINIFPIQKLILDKNAGKQIEYTQYMQTKIPLLIKDEDAMNIIGTTKISSLKNVCVNHIFKNSEPTDETLEIMMPTLNTFCEDVVEENTCRIVNILRKIDPYTGLRLLRHPQFDSDIKIILIDALNLSSQEKLAHTTLLKGITEKATNSYNEKNIEDLHNALALGANLDPILEKVVSHLNSCNNSHHNNQIGHSKNTECSFHDSIISWTFENYPYYTAYNLYKIFYTKYRNNQNIGQKIIEIIKSHHLLQHTFEEIYNKYTNSESAGEDIKTSERTLELFLKHNVILDHIEQSEKLKKQFVANATLRTLLLLKKQGVTFSNPSLIDIAEQSENPLKLHFILHEQTKLDEKPHTYFLKFLNNNSDHKELIDYTNQNTFYKNSLSQKYHIKIYKKMLDIPSTRDMRPLEDMVLSPHWQICLEISENIKKLNYFLNKINSISPRNIEKSSFDSFDQTYSIITKKLRSHYIPPKIISYMINDLLAINFPRKDFDFYEPTLTKTVIYTYNTLYSLLSVLSTKIPEIFPLLFTSVSFIGGAVSLGINSDIKNIMFSSKRRTRFQQYYYLQGFLQALATKNKEETYVKDTVEKINSKKIIAKLFLRKKKSEYLHHIAAVFYGLAIGKFFQTSTFLSLDETKSTWSLLSALGASIMYYLLRPNGYYFNDHSYQKENYASDMKQLEKSYIQQGMKDGLERLQKYKQYKERLAAKKLQSNLTNMFTQLKLHSISEIYKRYIGKKTSNEEL